METKGKENMHNKQEKPKRKPGRPRVAEKVYHAKPEDSFYRVDDVKEMLGLSQPSAYRIIKALRDDLIKEGALSERYPRGRIPKTVFDERMMIPKGGKSEKG